MGDQHQQTRGLELPPGFRFHPTDEEIITFYLAPKVLDKSFCATAIGEVDLNKSEPWELPGKAKMGEKEWYFYSQKDRKYPTGMRTNRATEAGYWKATGKDKEIYHAGRLVGMKKTLVFYKGRAPRGDKTNWVMHEYRLLDLHAKVDDQWVVCRVFHKTSGIKKVLVPSYHHMSSMAMNDQLKSMPMPMPMPMGSAEQGFPVVGSTCAAAAGTSLLPPPLNALMVMDPSSSSSLYGAPASSASNLAAGPSLNGGYYFSNHHQMPAPPPPQPMFYQQMQMPTMAMPMAAAAAGGGFMSGPASGPSSMLSQSQDTAASNDQNNAAAAEISSVDMGMDGMWKY